MNPTIMKESRVNVFKIGELLRFGKGDEEDDEDEEKSSGSVGKDGKENPFVMNENERKEWRKKIREVVSRIPDDVGEETDLVEKRKKMQKLLAEYPPVVDEEDPDWPENETVWRDDDYIRPIKD
ncbi:Thioredoxin superfamily protein [Striga hermonthica]|uniref:Thioredoxin superfamily protein n=1 Tax=Striga hermonthica TaxID=68872 RepID=A0A9N7RB50_STRHE|nr:Thioredoxin superfamily protein [Striga hermonthica]